MHFSALRRPGSSEGLTSVQLQPSIRSILDAVSSKARLFEVARHFGVAVPVKGTRAELATALSRSNQVRFRSLVEWMARDELRKACEGHGLNTSGRARQKLAGLLLEAHGAPESAPPPGTVRSAGPASRCPQPGRHCAGTPTAIFGRRCCHARKAG